MDATAPGPVLRSRGFWRPRLAGLAALVLAGILAQGCSDNNGRVTPTSSQVTGDAIGGPASLSLFVQVAINPATIDVGRRASILVIVTNANGFPLPNRQVQLTASGGNLDATSGVTDANGQFATTMVVPCGTAAAGGTVTAIVEGKVSATTSGTFTSVTPTVNDPCA
jgi:Bacterial Ig-like domain (group 1)